MQWKMKAKYDIGEATHILEAGWEVTVAIDSKEGKERPSNKQS